jgi:hypothetical protein
MLTINLSNMEDIRHLQRPLERQSGVNSLDPTDWWVHAQSTRDLADRMLVRGDTKGAEAMLYAAVELEKRHNAAITIMPFSSVGRDAVSSFDGWQSSHRPAVHSSATTINGRTRKAASDAPAPGNTEAWDPEMPSKPGQGVGDMPVLAFADFSLTRGVSVEPILSNGLADFQPAPISPQPLYRSSLRHRFLLGWTTNLYAHLRSVVESARQRDNARFVAIRPTLLDGSATGRGQPPGFTFR